MQILVTGCAGFIGYHLCQRLLADGAEVFGVDILGPDGHPALRQARLARLTKHPRFKFQQADISDPATQESWPSAEIVFHLAARAGVRHSLENPGAYFQSNILGSFRVLEWCRLKACRHLIFASSSSVYGEGSQAPFKENAPSSQPPSFYAATKASVELMAYSYALNHGLAISGARFFSVYGPWGRPDMALFKFTRAVLEGQPLELYGDGHAKRDFTYVDDVIEALCRLKARPPAGAPPFRVVNIGHGSPATVNELIRLVEQSCGKSALVRKLPAQAGDVQETHADSSLLHELSGFRPEVSLEEGVQKFVSWYREYARLNPQEKRLAEA